METKQIVICPNCFDMWQLQNLDYLESAERNKLINFKTDCHRCNKYYYIANNITSMFEWVYNKVKTIKGE